MGWATGHISKLMDGETVQFRPRGNSMEPKIKSKQLVTVEPLEGDPEVGDIVLCKVRKHQYLHMVKARKGDLFQIGNNKGGINGWVARHAIYGVCVKVED